MKGILISYFDEEKEYDIPMCTDTAGGIGAFRTIEWRPPGTSEFFVNILYFHAPEDNDSSMQITCLEPGIWCVHINLVQRRRFLGPFFPKRTSELLPNLNQDAVERLITNFYNDTIENLIGKIQLHA